MGRAAKGDGSIFKTPTGYRGYVTINGRRKYASGSKKTEVAQKLREIKNQRDNGIITVGRSPKLGAWIGHWMKATEEKHKIKTHAGYQSIIDDYLPTWLSDVTLAKLTAEHLEEAYDGLRRKPLSGATIYQLHSIIRAALTLAHKRGHVPYNAAKMVVSPPVAASKRVVPFSDADLARIFTVLEDSRSKARWTFALELGPRPGESLALEWPHIDFAEGSIRIEQQIQTVEKRLRLVKYTKTDSKSAPEYRKLPLPGHLADVFREHRELQLAEMSRASRWEDWRDEDEPAEAVHAFVFTSARRPGRPITPSGDSQQWARLVELAGLPHAKPYTARHTAASRMIAAGIDLTVVAEILGHADIKTLIKVYAHALEERKRAAADLLELAWRGRSAAPYPAPYETGSMRSSASR
ncbi:site-specific integrase [Agromyces mediolanus]|uniref:tyrosine-type recombinase/integrase n=1 Tax=Agromyces mediolanus TaxID=41986 RepID=UPI002040E0FE|nr:site-specific integrase [Agromyces mediolanus]MCM3657775.1 site-specific integrase [Agromyces mediolanus]